MLRTLLHKWSIIALLLPGAAVLFSCNIEKSEPDQIPGLNEKLKFNSSDYYAVFREMLESPGFSDPFVHDAIVYADTLDDFYAERGYQPLFINSFEGLSFIDSLLPILKGAEAHGLNPERYHYSLIKEEFAEAVDERKPSDRYIKLFNTEILIADALISYSYHLRYGAADPREIYPDSYYLPVKDSLSRDIFEPLRQVNIFDYLFTIQPDQPGYLDLTRSLSVFKGLQETPWEQIAFHKKIEKGKRDTSVSLIADRLNLLGFTVSRDSASDINLYDSLIAASVKEFQRIHGLKPDGIIGKSTIDHLNITPAQYVDLIKINLERMRWLDFSDLPEYIHVNIPEFMLRVFSGQKEKFNIVVCTGKKRSANYDRQYEIYKKYKTIRTRPDDWETPMMYGEVSHMVLNPTWTVPFNIIREEIAAELRKDSSYFQRKNFKIFKNGSRIDPSEVKAGALSSASIPYTIVQDPGAGNALGRIKFMFKNPFGIYLHDTPTRAPFTLPNRAVSHGCVRVEKPLMLAEFLLEHQAKWNLDYLKIEIGSKVDDKSVISEYRKVRSDLRKNLSFGQTTEVRLDKKIPLFITYNTAWIDEKGVLNIREDVYRKDQKLIERFLSATEPFSRKKQAEDSAADEEISRIP